jgi:hypothetical protein
VGKTTLAKLVQQEIKTRTTNRTDSIYLDLELDGDRRKLEDAEEYLKYHHDKCVVIDEVQRMPELFPLLRALVDIERRPARFILLGSASPEMIRGSSETLAGRIAYTELTPFSWAEANSTLLCSIIGCLVAFHKQCWLENQTTPTDGLNLLPKPLSSGICKSLGIKFCHLL